MKNKKNTVIYCKYYYKSKIHDVLDPIWQNESTERKRKKRRGHIYNFLSKKIGKPYHTASLNSLSEAQQIYCWLEEFVLKYCRKK